MTRAASDLPARRAGAVRLNRFARNGFCRAAQWQTVAIFHNSYASDCVP